MDERNSWVWQGRPWEAFKSFAILFSFVLNFILLIVLLLIGPLVFPVILNNTVEPIVTGLNDSFAMMNTATISQTIPLDTEMPLRTTIPLAAETVVVLTEPVTLDNISTTFVLPGGGGAINGTVSLVLPRDTALPVALNMQVPVSQTVPVVMAVPVQIELSHTDLGVPFDRLQSLFTPLDDLVTNLPSSNEELVQRAAGSVSGP